MTTLIYDNRIQQMRPAMTGAQLRGEPMAFVYVLRQRGANRYFVSGGPEAGSFAGLADAATYERLEDAERAALAIPLAVSVEQVIRGGGG